jgi:hypothetical protein
VFNRRNRRIRRQAPPTLYNIPLPDGLKATDIDPTWEELAAEYCLQQKALALAEVKRIELLEQREWLLAATQRAIATALLIDETERKLALREEMNRTDKWWAIAPIVNQIFPHR